MKKFIYNLASYILSFGASVFICVCVLLLTISLVFSAPYIKLMMGIGSYSEKAEKDIITELEAYAIPGGLPDDFFHDGLDKSLLKKDIKTAVDLAFKDETFEADEFKAALTKKINDYAKENNITSAVSDDEVSSGINGLVEHCTDSYTAFTYSLPLKYIGKIFGKLTPYILISAAVVLLACVGLCIYVKSRLGTQHFRNSLNGAGAMLILFPLFVLISGSISRLGVTSASIYSLLTSLLYSLVSISILVGVLLIIISIFWVKE